MTFEEMNKTIEEYCNGVRRKAVLDYSRKVISELNKFPHEYLLKGTAYKVIEEVFEEMFGKENTTANTSKDAQKDLEKRILFACRTIEKKLLEKEICDNIEYQAYSETSFGDAIRTLVTFTLEKQERFYSFTFDFCKLFRENTDKAAVEIILKDIQKYFSGLKIDYSRQNDKKIYEACNLALARLRKVFDGERKEDGTEIEVRTECTLRGDTIDFSFTEEKRWKNGYTRGSNSLVLKNDAFGDYEVDKYKRITEEDAKLIADYMVREGIRFGKEHGYEVNEGSEGWKKEDCKSDCRTCKKK